MSVRAAINNIRRARTCYRGRAPVVGNSHVLAVTSDQETRGPSAQSGPGHASAEHTSVTGDCGYTGHKPTFADDRVE